MISEKFSFHWNHCSWLDTIPPGVYYALDLFTFTSLRTLQSSDQSLCRDFQKSTCFCITVRKKSCKYTYLQSSWVYSVWEWSRSHPNVQSIHPILHIFWFHAITVNYTFTSPGEMQDSSINPHYLALTKSDFVKTLKKFKTPFCCQ